MCGVPSRRLVGALSKESGGTAVDPARDECCVTQQSATSPATRCASGNNIAVEDILFHKEVEQTGQVGSTEEPGLLVRSKRQTGTGSDISLVVGCQRDRKVGCRSEQDSGPRPDRGKAYNYATRLLALPKRPQCACPQRSPNRVQNKCRLHIQRSARPQATLRNLLRYTASCRDGNQFAHEASAKLCERCD